jgi:hypothetical protein
LNKEIEKTAGLQPQIDAKALGITTLSIATLSLITMGLNNNNNDDTHNKNQVPYSQHLIFFNT